MLKGVDYKRLQELKTRLEDNNYKDGKVLLFQSEINMLLEVLYAGEGSIFPSVEELANHEANVRLLNNTDPQKDPERWKWVSQEVTEFENKYC